MANIASQKKRIQRTQREWLENRRLTSSVKTHFRRLEQAAQSGDEDSAAEEHRQLVSRIDKAVQKGALHAQQRRPQEEPRGEAARRLDLLALPATRRRARGAPDGEGERDALVVVGPAPRPDL